MNNSIELYDAVRPIYGSSDGVSFEHRGTGFAIRYLDNTLFVTAEHVVDCDHVKVLKPAPIGNGFQGATFDEIFWDASVINKNKAFDLAILSINEYDGIAGFEVTFRDPQAGIDVVTYEYGQLAEVAFDTSNYSKKRIDERASFRKGNIVRMLSDQEFYGTGSFEFSFPAARKSSGAPLLSSNSEVTGVIIGNAGNYMEPINIPGDTEERPAFLLPAGIGMSINKLSKLV
ncbi:MAG: trypsin-like peptidase domain-containing protein [Pseudomonadota bacterium]